MINNLSNKEEEIKPQILAIEVGSMPITWKIITYILSTIGVIILILTIIKFTCDKLRGKLKLNNLNPWLNNTNTIREIQRQFNIPQIEQERFIQEIEKKISLELQNQLVMYNNKDHRKLRRPSNRGISIEERV